MKRYLLKACPIFSALLIFVSSTVFAAPQSDFNMQIEKLEYTPPYTEDYNEAAVSLSKLAQSSPPNEATQKQVNDALHQSLPRVAFYNQLLIKNLGNPQDVNVKNYTYAEKTIMYVDNSFSLMTSEYSYDNYKNSQIANEFKVKIQRIRDVGEEKLLLIENSIEAITDKTTKDEIELIYKSYASLQKNVDLISCQNVEKLMQYLIKFNIDTSQFSLRIVPQAEKNLNNLTDQSSLRMLALSLETKYQRPNESNVFFAYTPLECFRLSIDGMGGKISATNFTYSLKSKTEVLIALHESGKIFYDLDTDPQTITFQTELLGDYTIISPKDTYPYSTAFTSRMEWHYQNYVLSQLTKPIESYMQHSTHRISTAGITQVPYSIIESYAKGNRAINFTNEDVTLYPSVMQTIKNKTDDIPLDYLYTLARKTQDEAKLVFDAPPPLPEEPEKSPQQKQALPPSTIRLLAIAGALVFILAVILTIQKSKRIQTPQATEPLPDEQ